MPEGRPQRGGIEILTMTAATDTTFSRVGGGWVGRRLIRNGPARVDARMGGGVTLEHIIPRGEGGARRREPDVPR